MRDGMRNRWVVATTALMAALALTLAFLGAAPTGTVKAGGLAVTIVSLSSLTIFLVPLIALLLSYDAIVGEVDRGTMALLLAYPVARWQVVLGKVRRPPRHPRLRHRGRLRRSGAGLAVGGHRRQRRRGRPSASWSPPRFFLAASSSPSAISSARWSATAARPGASPSACGCSLSCFTTWVCSACSLRTRDAR